MAGNQYDCNRNARNPHDIRRMSSDFRARRSGVRYNQRLRVLFIGDIFGSPGRETVRRHLPALLPRYDLVIANGENAAGGFGLTGELAEELFELGVGVITTGNHVWDRKELAAYYRDLPEPAARVLRPANFPPGLPGAGLYQGRTRTGEAYAVLNLQGRVFLPAIDCPFRKADELLQTLPGECHTVVVDFHAEATSEKQAMGWYLDGRVSGVLGTHTHVPTADERILPKGTAFQTDVGMSGPYAGIIGCRPEDVLPRFLTARVGRLNPARDDLRLCGAELETDANGRATAIRRIELKHPGSG